MLDLVGIAVEVGAVIILNPQIDYVRPFKGGNYVVVACVAVLEVSFIAVHLWMCRYYYLKFG